MDTKSSREVDYVAIDVAKIVYSDSLQALKATLNQFNINSRAYSIFEVRDDSTCLTFEDGDWVTFFYERGQKAGESHFTDIDDACKEVLNSVGIGESRILMQSCYTKELKKRAKKNPSSREFRESIRKGLERLTSSAAL